MATIKFIGPFEPGEVYIGGRIIKPQPGTTITVPDQVALGLMAGDGSWWEIQPGGAGMLGVMALATSTAAIG